MLDGHKKKGDCCYLRFLNSFVPFMSHINSNPVSISCLASVSLWAILAVNSSVWFRNMACSMLM